MAFEFKFPDVGEGIHEGEIVRWRIAVGDEVKEDQPLVEMETAKAIVELPSPRAGTILALNGKEGDVIKVDAILVVIGEKGEAYKPEESAPSKEAAPGVVGEIPTDAGVSLPKRMPENVPQKTASANTPMLPRDRIMQSQTPQQFDGPIEIVPLKSIRKAIAAHMVKSAFTIPHVTHMDECEVSALVQAREKLKPQAEKQGIKLTFLAFIVKATVEALKKYPAMNATLDEPRQEIIYKKYYNIGIAVDTPDGLMVPVIKNADQKDVLKIAAEIAALAQACRDRKISPEQLQGGSFTITNIGSVGGIFATPIITYGQAGNLGVFRIKEKPVALEGAVVVRPMLTLALSFDHRIVDGAEAGRFVNEVMAAFSNQDMYS